MSHLFGDLLRQFRARKAGLTQSRLAELAGYDRTVLGRMVQGKKELTGPSGRERVVRLIGVLHDQGALATQEEANALLAAAHMPPLYAGQPAEAALLRQLTPATATPAGPPPPQEAGSSPPHRTNLPVSLTRFIGRERQVDELVERVLTARLLTLAGAGGVGKTRLAIEVASSFVDSGGGTPRPRNPGPPRPPGNALSPPSPLVAAFPDGVWLAELAPLVDPALVPRVVTNVFKLPDEPGRTPVQALCAYLTDRSLLLMLDNCEHVIGACAELVEALLRTCPRLHLLATSREALQVPGEVIWRVPSLSTPNPAHVPPLEQAWDYEAIQLFVLHAAAAQPGFTLTPENVSAIAQVCHRLDGIPLAIEMAAAQMPAMSLHEITAQLDNRFALLTSGRRCALPRQRTLRATLEWSYQLLAEPERVLLARLSVFADGCTADAAQVVCADAPTFVSEGEVRAPSLPLTTGGAGLDDVLLHLLQLVHKSIVVADTRSGLTRYRLLDTIRQFATEKLYERGEADALHKRLAAYLISLTIEELTSTTPSAHVPGWSVSDRQEAEFGNLRALVAWMKGQPQRTELSLRLITAFWELYHNRGHLAEPLTWLEDALARRDARDAIPAGLRAEALIALVRLYRARGYNLTRCAAQAEEAVALLEHVSDAKMKVDILYWVSMAAWERSDYGRACALAQQSLEIAQRLGYPHYISASYNALGYARLGQGDAAGAAECFLVCIRLGQESEQAMGTAQMLLDLFAVDPHAALVLAEQEMIRARVHSDPESLTYLLQAYAELLIAAGDCTEAKTCLDECLESWHRLHVDWKLGFGVARALHYLGLLALLEGNPSHAQSYCERSLELYRQAGDLSFVGWSHLLLGRVLRLQGKLDGAWAHLRRALDLYVELDSTSWIGLTLAELGQLVEVWGQTEQAARIMGAAAVTRSALYHLMTTEHLLYDRDIAAARERYAGTEYAAAWAEGERMSGDQAVAYALQGAPAEAEAAQREPPVR